MKIHEIFLKIQIDLLKKILMIIKEISEFREKYTIFRHQYQTQFHHLLPPHISLDYIYK